MPSFSDDLLAKRTQDYERWFKNLRPNHGVVVDFGRITTPTAHGVCTSLVQRIQVLFCVKKQN